MATQSNLVAGSRCICNAESDFVSRSAVLQVVSDFLQSAQLVRVSYDRKPGQDAHGRRTSADGRIVALESIREQIASLPDLMAEKTPAGGISESSGDLGKDFETCFSLLSQIGLQLASLPGSDQLDSAWHKVFQVKNLLRFIDNQISGSAGGQPESREESRPVTGKSPVTPAGANPPSCFVFDIERFKRVFSALQVDQLEETSEAVLNELESRGQVLRWFVKPVHSGVGEGDASLYDGKGGS